MSQRRCDIVSDIIGLDASFAFLAVEKPTFGFPPMRGHAQAAAAILKAVLRLCPASEKLLPFSKRPLIRTQRRKVTACLGSNQLYFSIPLPGTRRKRLVVPIGFATRPTCSMNTAITRSPFCCTCSWPSSAPA